MTKHKFKFYGFLNDRRIFIVKCSKTEGEFSTALWDLDKVEKNFCPCCKSIINKSEEKLYTI